MTPMAFARRIASVVMVTLITAYAISVAGSLVPRGRYEAVVRDAVASGVLASTVKLPLDPGAPTPLYNFNDCLILSMLVLPDEDGLFLRALSPRVPVVDLPFDGDPPAGFPPFSQCRDLDLTLKGGGDIPAAYYHRYLHGDWVVAKVLLAALSFETATLGLAAATTGLLLTLAGAAVINAVRRGNEGGRHRAYAALALILLSFYALPVFGRSLSFAPADIVIAGFLLFNYSRPPSTSPDGSFVTTAALFGALTAMFEFLTGGAPSGIVVVITLTIFDDGILDRRSLIRRTSSGIIAFTASLVMCFAIKMVAVVAIWGIGELNVFDAQLAVHMGGAGWDIAPQNAARLAQFGINPDQIKSSRFLNALYGFAKIVYFSRTLGLGSLPLGIVLVVLIPSILITRQAMRLRRSADPLDHMRVLLLLSACAVVPAWYFAFTRHTIVHAHFMFRPMVWPLALLIAEEAFGKRWTQTDPPTADQGRLVHCGGETQSS